jgi:hypothetical protein
MIMAACGGRQCCIGWAQYGLTRPLYRYLQLGVEGAIQNLYMCVGIATASREVKERSHKNVYEKNSAKSKN